jgi:branched-chain amino acid aminotransferase
VTIDIAIHTAQRVPAEQRERLLATSTFGGVFTDHMVTMKWTKDRDWHDARLQPYGPISLEPSAQVFHYGQEIFEGLKAYRFSDRSIGAFRPYANAKRFNRSAERMAMPPLPEETFVSAAELLISTDRDWVPNQQGHSLYLRPFMIATQFALGFYAPSNAYLFAVIASPAGAYFKVGIRPISVWLSTDYGRAAPGGTGHAKCGGNYAATLVALQQAQSHGCDQVVWLDPVERRWIDEMSTSNIFFVYGSRLVTPKLSTTFLAGITRDCVLTLAQDLGYTAEEGHISVEQWREDAASGALTEVFSCGTSSMITPVGRVKDTDGEFSIGDGQAGPVTMRLRQELMSIQSGEQADRYGWMHKIA